MKIHRPDLVEFVDPPQTAAEFWDTHCVDCGHDLHPMGVCSKIVGGDQNGPDYCPCALDYPALAAAYQRRITGLDQLAEAVERIRSHHDRTLRHSPTNRVGYCAVPDGISATYCETGVLLAAIR